MNWFAEERKKLVGKYDDIVYVQKSHCLTWKEVRIVSSIIANNEACTKDYYYKNDLEFITDLIIASRGKYKIQPMHGPISLVMDTKGHRFLKIAVEAKRIPLQKMNGSWNMTIPKGVEYLAPYVIKTDESLARMGYVLSVDVKWT